MKVLLVEDDASLRKSLVQVLSLKGVSVVEASSYIVAKDIIQDSFDGVVLTDICMEGKDGFDVLAFCQKIDPDLPVIFMTGHAEIPLAVRALRAGVYDFLEKPCHPDILLKAVRLANERRTLTVRNRVLEQKIRQTDPAARDFPGPSAAITKFRDDLRKLSALPVNIHIWGEEGIGKRLAAGCTTDLRASASQTKTMDLRHISSDELTAVSQAKDLNYLIIQNVADGSTEVHRDLLNLLSKHPNMQIVTTATTSLVDLTDKILPQGLYHRYNFVELLIPPLRDRPEDILGIFRTLLQGQSAALNIPVPIVSDAVLAKTSALPWLGNMSELRQWAQQIILDLHNRDQTPLELSLSKRMEAFEKKVLLGSLLRHKGVTTKVADELRLPLKTLYDRLARHNLKSSAYRDT